MQWLRRSTLVKRLLFSFLVVMVPLMAVSLGINYMSIDIAGKVVVDSYSNTLQLLTAQFDKSIEKLEYTANALLADMDLNAINQSPKDRMVLWGYRDLIKKLKDFSASSDIDNTLSLYLMNRDRVFSSKNGMDVLDKERTTLHIDGSETINKGWVLKNASANRVSPLTLCYEKAVQNSDLSSGMLVTVEIDQQQIVRLLQNIQITGGGTAFLFDSGGNSIFTNGSQAIDLDTLRQIVTGTEKDSGQHLFHSGGEEYRVIFQKSERTNLVLVMYYPENQLMKPILSIQNWIYIVIGISVLLGLIFIFSSYSSFIKPVHKLVKAMESVRGGDLKTRIIEGEKEELGFIYTQFNSMVGKIDELISEVYVEHLNYQRAQLKFLQSQINPHFLFNCLALIYQMAKAENMDGVANMSLYLGKYFRAATRSNKDMVLVREEMDDINAYIQIQSMRYPGKIHYVVDLPDEALNAVIPRLVIQPVIENAVVHGIEVIDRPGSICVTGEIRDNTLVIIVEDDGKGMGEEKMRELNETLNAAEGSMSGEGLTNPNLRLKLKFGNEAGISLYGKHPQGMRVRITIPYSKGETVNA